MAVTIYEVFYCCWNRICIRFDLDSVEILFTVCLKYKLYRHLKLSKNHVPIYITVIEYVNVTTRLKLWTLQFENPKFITN